MLCCYYFYLFCFRLTEAASSRMKDTLSVTKLLIYSMLKNNHPWLTTLWNIRAPTVSQSVSQSFYLRPRMLDSLTFAAEKLTLKSFSASWTTHFKDEKKIYLCYCPQTEKQHESAHYITGEMP